MAETIFLKVECRDCGSQQTIFERAASHVSCDVCSATLATPTGGRAEISGDIVEEMD